MKTKKFHGTRVLILGSLIALMGVSCVPGRQYKDCKTSLNQYKMASEASRTEQERLAEQLRVCEEQLLRSTREAEALRRDTSRMMSALDLEFAKNNQLNQTYELLLQKNKELLADNRYQTEKISTELATTQEQLIRKEDALKKLESDLLQLQQTLTAKEENLNRVDQDLKQSKQGFDESMALLEASRIALEASQKELNEKQQKLMELQRILVQKDSTVTALRNTVATALLGFADKGLKVEERNGKVYVSMDNKLLFASASTSVGSDGQKALGELARVLAANPEINILVEGHTDDLALRPSAQMKDNWDLSVLRATEIVRIILAGGNINPSRITAAGRSQYAPVDSATTAEARTKNRRTEIILTPKLDELFKVIESN